MQSLGLPTFDLSLGAIGVRAADGSRAEIRWLLGFTRDCGYRAIQINAADPLTRPRELTRSGRRDLAAHLRRNELTCSGVDLWIPRSHFTDPAKSDHVASTLLDAVEFTADLADLTGGHRVLSTAFPTSGGEEIRNAVIDRALSQNVQVADHRYPWPEDIDGAGPLRIGIDPAAVILAGADPAEAVSRASTTGLLAAVRLSDLAASGRVVPGEGSLVDLSFRVAVATSRYQGPLVVDLRGLPPGEESGGQLHTAYKLFEGFAHKPRK
jgi:sugar phosphate isomerase/epimerase